MPVYKIGYYSYEESPSLHLVHDVAFTPDEFREMVYLAAEAIVRKWVGIEDLNYDYGCRVESFSDLFPDAISDFLIAERGFKPIEVQATLMLGGWCPLLPEKSDTPSRCPENQVITRRLIDAGLDVPLRLKNAALLAEHEANWEARDTNDDSEG